MTELSTLALSASLSTLSSATEEETDDLLLPVDPLQLQSLMASLDLTSSSSSLIDPIMDQSLLDSSEDSESTDDSSIMVNLTSLVDHESTLNSDHLSIHNSDNESITSDLSSLLASIHTSSLGSAIVGLFNATRSGSNVDQIEHEEKKWKADEHGVAHDDQARADHQVGQGEDCDQDNMEEDVEIGGQRQVRFVDSRPSQRQLEHNVTNGAVMQESDNENELLMRQVATTAKIGAPPDRLYLAYVTFVAHGFAAAMPWTMLATANPPSTGESFNDVIRYLVKTKLSPSKLLLPPHLPPPEFARHFLDSLFFTTQVANVFGHAINVFMRSNGRLGSKIMWTLCLQGVGFLLFILLAMIDTESWTHIFLNMALYDIAIMCVSNGIYVNTMVGIAAKLPPHYLTAFVLGSNLGGTVVSMLRLISLWMAPDTRTSAIYLFLMALFVSLACFDSYFALPLNRFVRHYTSLYADALEEKNELLDSPAIPYCSIFARCSLCCLGLYLTGLVSKLVFPAVVVEVAKVEPGLGIPDEYFVVIVGLLTFHFCALVGNLVCVVTHPTNFLLAMFLALVRSILAPFLVLCNYRPLGVERLWPVLIRSESLFWMANALLALSDGFCVSSLLGLAVRSVKPMYGCVAAMMGVASLALGHASGAAMANLLPDLVSLHALNFEEPDWWIDNFQG